VSETLRQAMLVGGAVISGMSGRPLHFGDAAAELGAALDSAVVVGRDELARALGDGPDLLDLLDRLSTNAVKGLAPGQGVQTVLTTPKGRIVERLFVHHLVQDSVLLVGGRGAATRMLEHIGRYTFRERTGLVDAAERLDLISVCGPRTAEALRAADLLQPPAGGSVRFDRDGGSVDALGHDGLGPGGVTFAVPPSLAAELWRAVSLAVGHVDGRPAGSEAMEAWRVLRGLPAAPAELNEGHNPLEAGLWDAVSFNKGCYVGQEVVARLNTYDKVSRVLLGLELPRGAGAPEPGTPLYVSGRQVGEVTTALLPPGRDRAVALCYIKRREVGIGDTVAVGDSAAPPTALLVEGPASTRR